jgi:hypothetical protein
VCYCNNQYGQWSVEEKAYSSDTCNSDSSTGYICQTGVGKDNCKDVTRLEYNSYGEFIPDMIRINQCHDGRNGRGLADSETLDYMKGLLGFSGDVNAFYQTLEYCSSSRTPSSSDRTDMSKWCSYYHSGQTFACFTQTGTCNLIPPANVNSRANGSFVICKPGTTSYRYRSRQVTCCP